MAFKRKLQASVGTVITAVGGYTVPVNTQTTVIGLAVANLTANNIFVDISLYDGVTDYHIIKGAPVPVGGTLVVVGGDQKVVMEPGDSIRVVSDTAASADVIMSVLEI